MSRHVVATRKDSRYVIVAPRGGENMMDDWHERMDDAVDLWYAGASDAAVRNAMSANPKVLLSNRLR